MSDFLLNDSCFNENSLHYSFVWNFHSWFPQQGTVDRWLLQLYEETLEIWHAGAESEVYDPFEHAEVWSYVSLSAGNGSGVELKHGK